MVLQNKPSQYCLQCPPYNAHLLEPQWYAVSLSNHILNHLPTFEPNSADLHSFSVQSLLWHDLSLLWQPLLSCQHWSSFPWINQDKDLKRRKLFPAPFLPCHHGIAQRGIDAHIDYDNTRRPSTDVSLLLRVNSHWRRGCFDPLTLVKNRIQLNPMGSSNSRPFSMILLTSCSVSSCVLSSFSLSRRSCSTCTSGMMQENGCPSEDVIMMVFDEAWIEIELVSSSVCYAKCIQTLPRRALS